MAMTNVIPANELILSSTGLLSSNPTGKAGTHSDAAPAIRLDKVSARRAPAGIVQQSLLCGLLDPRSSSRSLAALARAAASSGKRLILEIRDETPVRIVRTSTKGM
jgi:hypothetical protein